MISPLPVREQAPGDVTSTKRKPPRCGGHSVVAPAFLRRYADDPEWSRDVESASEPTSSTTQAVFTARVAIPTIMTMLRCSFLYDGLGWWYADKITI
jgi:hypothetical protein